MHYELVTILSPKLSETEVTPVQQAMRDVLAAMDATMTFEAPIEKRKLAYPIQREQFGYYLRVEFDADEKAVGGIKNKLQIAEHVLRAEVIKKRVKTPEELAHEARARERMAQERAAHVAAPAQETSAPAAAPAPAPAPAIPSQPVNIEELDKKLDELLDISVDKI